MVKKLILFLMILTLANPIWASSSQISHAVGQMMMVGFNGTSVDENSKIVKEIKNYHIGGVILDKHMQPNTKKSSSNIENPAQLKKLISQLQFYAKKYNDYPLFIAVNQEGGLINTLTSEHGFINKNDPSQQKLGESNNQKLIFEAAYKRAMLLKNVGINLNLAPVADLNINPDNPAVGKLQRSFGNDVNTVTENLKNTIKAYKKAKILCALKHFPGLGSANKNTDYDNADLTNTWNESELLPYKKLIESHSSCPFIMATHLINFNLDQSGAPASLSKKIVTELLINKLQYQGLIITDDMDAAAIRKNMTPEVAIKKAVLAGNNVIIFGGTQGHDPDQDAKILYDILVNLAKNNTEARYHVIKSYHKIISVKKNLME